MRAGAQTAADAAALAGAGALRSQVVGQVGVADPPAGFPVLNPSAAEAAAATYAASNGAELVAFQVTGTDVRVRVRTIDSLTGRTAGWLGVEGHRGQADARARLHIGWAVREIAHDGDLREALRLRVRLVPLDAAPVPVPGPPERLPDPDRDGEEEEDEAGDGGA